MRRLSDILIMQNRPMRWFALLAFVALGIGGALWLVREHDEATREAARGSFAAGPVEANVSPAKDGGQNRASGDVVRSIAPAQGVSADVSTTANVHLDFQLPATTKLGGAFDLIVTINTRVPVQRLTFEIEFDQRLVRPRTLEEVEYSNHPAGTRMFAAEPSSDGRVSVTLGFGVGTPGSLPSSTAVAAQFEALAPGPAQIKVATINAVDRSGRPISVAASGNQSRIEINPN